MAQPTDRPPEHRNEVLLVGRLAAEAQQRVLPSGDRIVTFRLVVERPPVERRNAGRQGGQLLDALECTAWGAAARRSALRWTPGDVVCVEGRLRRRFQRTDGPTVSHYGVEVVTATRLTRASEPAVPAGARGG